MHWQDNLKAILKDCYLDESINVHIEQYSKPNGKTENDHIIWSKDMNSSLNFQQNG